MGKYSYSIDTLRLFAMLCVFSTHCFLMQETDDFGRYIYQTYCIYGGYAVEFFIMLSGIMQAYTFKDFNIHDKKQYKSYIKRKAWRLFPLHWVCMLLYLPLAFTFCGSFSTLRALIPTALLLQSWHRYTFNIINGPAWTISVLFTFYLLTPWFMSYIKRINKGTTCLILLAILLIANHYQNIWLRELRPDDVWFYYAAPHTRIFNYMIGLILGYSLRRFSPWDFIVRYATLLEITVMCIFLYVATHIFMQFHLVYSLMALITYLLFLGNGWLSRLLSAKIFIPISKLSFSFYLIHYFFIALGQHLFKFVWYKDTEIPLNECIILLSATLFLSFLSAWALHELVEKRLERYKHLFI